jgi:hypothetical protein
MPAVAPPPPNSGYFEAVRRQAEALGVRSARGWGQPVRRVPIAAEFAKGSVEFETWQQSQPR